MRLFNASTCSAYWLQHPTTRPALRLWVKRMQAETYANMDDVRIAFASSRPLNGERVRFEIGSHRLIVAFDFRIRAAYIKFLGTHAAYDRIDALTVEDF